MDHQEFGVGFVEVGFEKLNYGCFRLNAGLYFLLSRLPVQGHGEDLVGPQIVLVRA